MSRMLAVDFEVFGIVQGNQRDSLIYQAIRLE